MWMQLRHCAIFVFFWVLILFEFDNYSTETQTLVCFDFCLGMYL